MNSAIAVLTGVGGHFLNGWRLKGYSFVIAVVGLPLIVFVLETMSLAYWGATSPSPKVFSAVFLLGLLGLWMVSSTQSIRDRQSRRLGTSRVSVVEVVGATIVVYAVTFYSVLALVIAPNIRPGEELQLLSGSSSKAKG